MRKNEQILLASGIARRSAKIEMFIYKTLMCQNLNISPSKTQKTYGYIFTSFYLWIRKRDGH